MATAQNRKPKPAEPVNPDEPVEAKVIEKHSADGKVDKTISYATQIKPAPAEDQNEFGGEDEDFENFDDFEIEPTPQKTAPPTQLESMFERLRYAVENGREVQQDGFFASVVRVPDLINANNNVPCHTQMELGIFQFTVKDRFNFIPQVQKLNGNSGGTFNITIYGLDYKPLQITPPPRAGFPHRFPIDIQLVNWIVPNPIATPNTDTPQVNNGIAEVVNLMREQMQQSNNQFQTMLREMKINQPQESEIDKAVKMKMLDMIINPNRDNQSKSFEDTMQQFLLMPIVAEKMAKKMFPDTPQPETPSTMDSVVKLLDTPVVANVIDGIIELADKGMVAKMQAQQTQPPATAPRFDDVLAENPDQPQPQPEQEAMNKLITSLIEELESDRPLDTTNEFLSSLQIQYPEQSEMLIESCKEMSFKLCSKMLLQTIGNLPNSPLPQFLDLPTTETQGQLVYNERGIKLLVRLEEFYNFVRTL